MKNLEINLFPANLKNPVVFAILRVKGALL